MRHPVTFFRHRQPSSGFTYSFDLESPNRQFSVFLYSPTSIDDSLLRSRKTAKTEEFNAEIERILKAVSPEGVLVVMYEERELLLVRVVPAAGSDAPVARYGVLRPGLPISLESVARDKPLEIPLGAHLIVPVNRETEERLQGLLNQLACLPPDMEAAILYTIGNPGLEVRVSRLEAKDPRRGGEPRSGWMGRLKDWLGRQVPLWSVVLFLVLLVLGLNAYLFHSLSKKIDAMKPSPAAVPGTPPGSGKGKQGEEPTPPDPAALQKILEVSAALGGQQGQGTDFASLYAAHFSTLQTVDNVAGDLKKERERQSLALGLMKLEALRLDRAGGAPLVGERDDYRKLKKLFKAHLKDQSEASAMVAALGCEAYKVPGLPSQAFGGGVKSAAFLADNRKDCTGSSLKDAVPGLEQLVAFVKNPDDTN